MGCFRGCFGGGKDGALVLSWVLWCFRCCTDGCKVPKCQGHGRQNAALEYWMWKAECCFGGHERQNAAERATRIDYGTPKRATEPVNVNAVPQQLVSEEQFSASCTKKGVTFDSNVKTYEPVVVSELMGLSAKSPVVRMNSEEVNSPFKASRLADEGSGVKAGYARDGSSTYVHPVLNPVENLSQWKAVKSKGTPLPLKPQKENSTTDFEAPRIAVSAEPSLKHLAPSKPKPNQLKTTNRSSGLETITPERSGSQCSNSVISFEDRPILGVLTVEELRYMSATNSPRKTPTHSPDDRPIIGTVGTYWNDTSSKKDSAGSNSPFKGNKSVTNSPRKSPTYSPDETPIIGTVGSYWNDTSSTKGSARKSSFRGIPNRTSIYREDKEVKWHETPFETMLERALNGGGSSELD